MPLRAWFSTLRHGFLGFVLGRHLLRGFFQLAGLLAEMGELVANP